MKRNMISRSHSKESSRVALLGAEPAKRSGTRRPATAVGTRTVAEAVREGLGARRKWLPPWLFYDAEGSRLFERITHQPEYYLTRAETEILSNHKDRIVRAALDGARNPLRFSVMELGAGTATKSQILLSSAVTQLRPWGGRVSFVPVDISETALVTARERLASALPELDVRPIVGDHEAACSALGTLPRPRLVLFLGSSMGNFDDGANISLFRAVRDALEPGDAFVVGADRRNPVPEILAAYDDEAGVTAEFNRNILARINRELAGQFDLSLFAHVARWNEKESRVEMHLESLTDQRVLIRGLGMMVTFRQGETIHTESSVKYDDHHVEAILNEAGFQLESSYVDTRARFGLHLARAGVTKDDTRYDT